MTRRERLMIDQDVKPANGPNTARMFLTTAEAAAFLRLSPITMSRWRIEGYGPQWIKMGPKRVLYAIDDLSTFANGQKRMSTSDQ